MSIDTPQGISNAFEKPLLAVRATEMLRLLEAMKINNDVEDCYPFGEYHHAVMKRDFNMEGLEKYLEEQLFQQLQIKPVRADIEDCFIALMKKK